jgi:hypothetical protein
MLMDEVNNLEKYRIEGIGIENGVIHDKETLREVSGSFLSIDRISKIFSFLELEIRKPRRLRGEVMCYMSGDLQAELNEKENCDITHNANLGARNDIAKT